MKPYAFHFTVAALPSLDSAQRRSHWRTVAKEAKRWHTIVCARCSAHRPPAPLLRARLTLVRCSSTEPDEDGLAHSFKPVVDGLKHAMVIVDDSRRHVERVYLWQRARPRHGMIGVRIEELEVLERVAQPFEPLEGLEAFLARRQA